jgi:CheY-like chemotaxis protein
MLMLQESSERLLSTITNYMDISLLTSGNMSVNKKDFVPGQVMKSIFDRYIPICSDKNLRLFLDIPERVINLSVNSDPELFQKILCHLLNNAIKFTEKGDVKIGINVHEEELEFYVKDTGIGIGKESLESVFKNFEKEDRGSFKFIEGSGLGLSISKGMTELLGGKMYAESEIEKGSNFLVSIPLIIKTREDVNGAFSEGRKKSIKGTSILVAEDDDSNFFFINAILSHETGAKILHARDGKKAIEMFKSNPDLSLILMDIKMPEIDGYEATRQIKILNKEIPVIAITAYAMSGDEEKALAAGCDGYLSKPINKKILLEKIAEYLNI